ncbi:MAG TPA: MFS transporter [Pseudonocardiaceae bacterium]
MSASAAPEAAAAPQPAAVQAGVRGTYVAFITAGFALASWASRIPQVRDHLHLSSASLGLLLLWLAVGNVLAMPLSGIVVQRLGTRRTVTVMAVLLVVALTTVGVGYTVGVVPVAVGLFLFGYVNGLWDVAMNVHGALVERHLRRSIMSRFHAGFSLGTVGGALLGAAMIAVRVPVPAHLIGVGIVLAVITVWWGSRQFLPRATAQGQARPARPEQQPRPSRRGPLAAWREPRTLLIGLFVLAFAFAEGTGNDWVSIAMIDGHGTTAAVGTLAFAVFLSAMTLGRWFGTRLLDSHGRVAVIRVLSVIAIGGALLFVFAPVTPLAFAGTALWGLGTSLGFPVGMSAGADEPRYAAGRVAVISAIGYCAFLAGPPAIGFLGSHFTVPRAIIAVAVLLGLAALVTSAVAPLDRSRDSSRDSARG